MMCKCGHSKAMHHTGACFEVARETEAVRLNRS